MLRASQSLCYTIVAAMTHCLKKRSTETENRCERAGLRHFDRAE
jgi:hypothetical protein